MPYPTHLDLDVFLASRGLSCSDLTKTDKRAAIARAIRKWEHDSGWRPFLANEEDETRIIDGPEGRMIFPTFGILSLTSFSIDGTDYVADTSYWLQSRWGDDGPYTAIEFDGYITGARRAVELVGKFGYTLTLPEDVKDALLSYAAWGLYAQITGIDGELKREKQGPVEFEYQQPRDGGQYQGKRGALLQAFEVTLNDYRWARL
jgi:hypothetical protein